METIVSSSDLTDRYLFPPSTNSERVKRNFSKRSSNLNNVYKFPEEPSEARRRSSSTEPYCFSKAPSARHARSKSRVDTVTSTDEMKTEVHRSPTGKPATVRFRTEQSYLEQARNRLEPRRTCSTIVNDRVKSIPDFYLTQTEKVDWKSIEKSNRNFLRSIENQSLQRELNSNLIRCFSTSYLDDLRREELIYVQTRSKTTPFSFEDVQDLHTILNYQAFKMKLACHRERYPARALSTSSQNSISSLTIDLKTNTSVSFSPSISNRTRRDNLTTVVRTPWIIEIVYKVALFKLR